MSEEAYQEGWRTNDPMADIKRFRTEIALTTAFGQNNKKGSITFEELARLSVSELADKYKHTTDPRFASS
jgi:hypothetical protein